MIDKYNRIKYFSSPSVSHVALASDTFFNPFGIDVHPLAVLASQQLQKHLQIMAEKKGMMFGVLVVEDQNGDVGFLSAYSGRAFIDDNINSDGISFVPAISSAGASSSVVLKNALNEHITMDALFSNPHALSGVGDCTAPKLLQYAYQYECKPIALAEFWFGLPANDHVRHHQSFYPACRGKCWPILPFMLQGLNVQPLIIPGFSHVADHLPEVVYDDEHIALVNKPAGLLSVPGKEIKDAVLTRLQKRYPDATGPLLLHRLDLLTSGLLLMAKTESTHKILQQQFMNRTIKKRYVALLSSNRAVNIADEGTIDLPLRVDIEDRPRQMVCYQHGKKAQTQWQVISRDEKTIRVHFYPITGRTHQLRVHAAHYAGLNSPIMCDPLYGDELNAGHMKCKDARLMLHAEQLTFIHPVTGNKMMIKSPPPF